LVLDHEYMLTQYSFRLSFTFYRILSIWCFLDFRRHPYPSDMR